MNLESICVCGAGTMGRGIAQVSAVAGFYTILFELDRDILEKSRVSIMESLQVLVAKKKLSVVGKEIAFDHIHFTSDLADCLTDIVIEAIVENADAKINLLTQVARINNSTTILATNTSSLSLSGLAARLPHPERVAGLHFFNPAPVMKLVEVVRTKGTANEVIDSIVTLAKRFGKIPVVCKDSPGFIVNRVARPFYIESLRLLEEGEVGLESIDRLLETSGFKMGPFKLMDLIGNDINYAVSTSVFEQLNKPERLRPSVIQKEKVERGEWGKKTGKGYYDYKVSTGNV